jgi:SAM-dependent methyltransferase
MHPSAMTNGKLFFDTYVTRLGEVTVVEIGAQDVNGSLRRVCPPRATYIGVDFADARGVDVILKDPYTLPFDDESIDVVVSSSCFEHSEMFWLVFNEVLRVLRSSGLFYLNAPSNGVFHRFPVDCWRFYPDSGGALVTWARRCGINAALIESYTTPQQADVWNDFVAVFAKEAGRVEQHPNRMISPALKFENGVEHGGSEIVNWTLEPEDLRVAQTLRATVENDAARIAQLEADLIAADQRNAVLAEELSRSKSEVDNASRKLGELQDKLRRMEVSASWKITAPLRVFDRSID